MEHRSNPFERHTEAVNWLKAEHEMGHGHANAIVAYVRARDRPAERRKNQWNP